LAIRDKLRACAQQFLEPGEAVTQVFEAQLGNPWVLHGLQGLGIGIAVTVESGSRKYPGIAQMLVLFATFWALPPCWD
jgi:hypothetical protein